MEEIKHGQSLIEEKASPTSAPDPRFSAPNLDEYPEGGLQAWSVVLGAWCAMVPSMGLLNSMAVLQAWLSEHELQGMQESKMGWIFSAYAFFLFFCGAQIGPIFDSHSIRILIVSGTVGIVLAIVLFSFSQEFYQFFLSFGVLGGISASFLFNPSISAVGHWFLKRRGLATGIACTSGGFGGVWMPLVILYLAPKIGFGWAMRVIALICAVHGLAACYLLRKRLPPNKISGSSIDLKALADVKYTVLTLGLVLVEFSIFIPLTYICSYGIYYGYSFHDAYMLSPYLNVGAVFGRALPGYGADRFGVINVMAATMLICMVLILGVWLSAEGNEAMVISFGILFGFWSGTSISLAPVCIGLVCETKDYGKRSGTAFTITSFGTLIGIPLAGALLENDASYRGLIIFSGGAYLVGFIIYMIGRGLVGGWKVFARC